VAGLLHNIFAATALAWSLWLFAVQRLPAGTAGMGTLVTPVIGVLPWMNMRRARRDARNSTGKSATWKQRGASWTTPFDGSFDSELSPGSEAAPCRGS
jgi:hypothetical protein